jgi:hypothetical protein
MNKLQAGFARVNITPMMGIELVGYFFERPAAGVLDELEINALALACGEEKAVILTVDNEGLQREVTTDFRQYISEQTGLPMEAIYIHSTHSHNAPIVKKDSEVEIEREYYNFIRHKIVDVTKFAFEDLKPTKMGWGIGKAPNISFVRRYRMKDGSVQTNPGLNNPEILNALGKVDDRVSVLRFEREGGDSLVLVHFANHPDSVGEDKISADWPGFTRRTVEKAIDGTKCIVVNGAQGDINHVNVHPTGGYMNDIRMDFDGPRSYKHSEYLGRVVTAGVLQAYDKVQYTDVDTLKYKQRTIRISSNMPTPEELPEAHRIDDLHNAGRDDELGYSGMMLTTVVAEAWRMVSLEHGPEYYEMDLSAIAIGDIAFVGIPGEPFAGIGFGIGEAEGWDLVLTTCITNGKQGYFPMKEAYDEGGYESRSSFFKVGVAETIIKEGKELLKEIHA